MDKFFEIVFEPSILLGNIAFAIALIAALYKKKSKNNFLYICLHFLIIFIIESVSIGVSLCFFNQFIHFNAFYIAYFLASLIYIIPIEFFDNKNKIYSKIAMVFLIYAMNFILGEIGGSIPILVQDFVNAKLVDTIVRNLLNATIIIFGFFMRKYSLNKIKNIPVVAIVFLSIYAFFEIFLTYYSGQLLRVHEFNVSLFKLLTFVVIGTINYLSYYMIFAICSNHDALIQLQIKNFELEKNKELLAISEENLQKLRALKHDSKNQYECMKVLLENKQYDELNRFFKNYGDGIIEPISFIDCNNKIISSILNMKYSKARANNIGFDVKIAVRDNLSFDSIDISSLLSNLLDNAIEACLFYQIKDPIITIRIREYQSYLYIEVINPTGKDLTLDRIKKIKTTKKDKDLHGFGIKIVKQIVKKYNGVYENKIEDEKYIVKIMIEGENNEIKNCNL